MIDKIRRIVTGEMHDGRSVFTHLEEVPPVMMGAAEWYGVWGWDQRPSLPYHDTAPYVARSSFPDPLGDGMRLNVVVFPPGSGLVERSGHARPEASTSSEGTRLAEAQEHGHTSDPQSGMHSTDSVDIGVVLSGEMVLEQGAEEVTLRPGDIYIQNGAAHAWRNRSTLPCTIVFVVLSAARKTGGDDTAST